MKGKIIGVIGVIVGVALFWYFIFWWVTGKVEPILQETGSVATWQEIKDLYQKKADQDVQLQEAKKQKEELIKQLATIDGTIEQIIEARRTYQKRIDALIDGAMVETGTDSGEALPLSQTTE